MDLTCVPNEGLLALNPTSGEKDQNGFLVGLTASSNVHSSVSTPVLLIFVVIITVILGLAFSTLILVARRWYAKMTNFDYSPQHFILATNGTPKIIKDHYQSYGAAVNAEANTYATMPVSYRRSRASNNASMEHLESSNNSKSPMGIASERGCVMNFLQVPIIRPRYTTAAVFPGTWFAAVNLVSNMLMPKRFPMRV